ncbi:hypothetical protein L218DRAFT_1005100 [Marasmius fiardii PR-910]|nr:hypothetical protein L218DRAFT_1005100 [Marasmius fiardii PR-910]
MASRELDSAVKEISGNGVGFTNNYGFVATVEQCLYPKTVFAGLFALYHYLRYFIYPCLTPYELEKTSKILDDAYNTARNGLTVETDPQEWNTVANDYLAVKLEASRIRQRAFQASLWKTCFGFYPGLILDIARWYTTCDELECRILTARERDLQSHLGAEQYRRRIAATTSLTQIQPFASIYESPFRYEDSPRPYSTPY